MITIQLCVVPRHEALMHTTRRLVLGICTACTLWAQSADVVRITGEVKDSLTLSAADLAKLPRATVRASLHGTETVYQGVWLHEVLKRAGVPQGTDLRGKALSSCVLAIAQDGYQVLFSLAELDPTFIDNEILLADTANGKPLSGAQGRFRLVVPKDKPGARSVRMLIRIEVVRLQK
jgi:DMSO/TMAO reductase YedYZ molybdopterin-dependent catalytic subunit